MYAQPANVCQATVVGLIMHLQTRHRFEPEQILHLQHCTIIVACEQT